MSVAITGTGAVTPLGVGVACMWQGLLDGACGIGPLTRFSTEGLAFTQGGEIPDFELPEAAASHEDADLGTQYMLAAAWEAWLQADIAARVSSGRIAVVLATNFGGVATGEDLLRYTLGEDTDPLALEELVFQQAVDRVAALLAACGPRTVLSLSCSSGAAAIGLGSSLIRSGRADVVLVGGYDALSPFCWSGLSALRTMSKEGVRPFDLERNGTVFSEGAGAMVLERAQRAGDRALGHVVGYGLNNNAFHMTAPSKDNAGAVAVMQAALADADLGAEAISHVNVHGTGTQYNDVAEAQAMRAVFGERAAQIPVAANKASLGHTMGAAGCLEAIVSVRSMAEGRVPPTIHHTTPDPDCLVDLVVGEARSCDLPYVLSNSAGIGGTNASLVLARGAGA